MVEQTLNIPLFAYGKGTFAEKLNLSVDDVELIIKNLLKKIKHDHSLSKDDLLLLIKGILFVRDITGISEYQTVTGFTWEESTKFIVKLAELLSNDDCKD